MNKLPTFIASMTSNQEGQIVLQQKSIFSFFHQGVPFMVQLTRAYHKGMDMGDGRGYVVRLSGFLGFLPNSLQGGIGLRNKVLSLIYRSNYNDSMKFYVNYRQMIIAVCYNDISEEDALNVRNLIATTTKGYADLYPFLELFATYVSPPGKISKRYEVV